jgi:DHA2 family multidrug resistance protein
MIDLLRMTPDVDFWFFAWSRVILGVGLPLIFIPITAASYDGIPPSKTDQASALINLARNFGGSIGVSLSQTMLAQREQFHQSRLIEHIGTWNPVYNDTFARAQEYLRTQSATGNTSGSSVAIIGQILQGQAVLLAYIDVFVMLAALAGLMIPLALSLRTVKRKGPAPAH